MPAVTTAYVKNIIRRGFSELVDPSPTREEQDLIWAHFKSTCAFCGRLLNRKAEEGRIDHLLAASKGGANALGNRVLSCGCCNDKEKLDQQWETFLAKKVNPSNEFAIRKKQILEWQSIHRLPDATHHRVLRDAADRIAADVIKYFESSVSEIRILKDENLR
jgi:hypothetical protein